MQEEGAAPKIDPDKLVGGIEALGLEVRTVIGEDGAVKFVVSEGNRPICLGLLASEKRQFRPNPDLDLSCTPLVGLVQFLEEAAFTRVRRMITA